MRVVNRDGSIAGFQDKVQLDPSEEATYSPGAGRSIFTVGPLTFGVAICHEGWRYPETVRWAAVRGAKIVFHPQHTGYTKEGVRLTEWGAASSPYYEKAMMMRSRENTIYFASVNYALPFQESATSLIAPSGECQAYLPYGQEGVLVQEIRADEATGLPIQHVDEALGAAHASVSLNQTVGADDEGELGDLFADREAADPFDEAEESLRRQSIRRALDALPERERRILELRFGFERSIDVGKPVGKRECHLLYGR